MFNKKRAYFIEASGGSAKIAVDQPVLLNDDVPESVELAEAKNSVTNYLKPTIISEGFEFVGEIKAACHLAIDGIVRGTISAPTVHIGKKALIDAKINCENITIKGHFLGTLDCNSLTVVTDAIADGQLNFQEITIQRGGIVKGTLKKKQLVRS